MDWTDSVIHELVNDDWERLYVNGKVIAENHSISPADWLKAFEKLGVNTSQREVKEMFPSV
jgi:hypothetical protein